MVIKIEISGRTCQPDTGFGEPVIISIETPFDNLDLNDVFGKVRVNVISRETKKVLLADLEVKLDDLRKISLFLDMYDNRA